jgi:hypothetical protein
VFARRVEDALEAKELACKGFDLIMDHEGQEVLSRVAEIA